MKNLVVTGGEKFYQTDEPVVFLRLFPIFSKIRVFIKSKNRDAVLVISGNAEIVIAEDFKAIQLVNDVPLSVRGGVQFIFGKGARIYLGGEEGGENE